MSMKNHAVQIRSDERSASWRPDIRISMVREERVKRYASTVSATSIDSARPLIYKPFSLFFPSISPGCLSSVRGVQLRRILRRYLRLISRLNNSLPRYFIDRGPRAIYQRFMARDRPRYTTGSARSVVLTS